MSVTLKSDLNPFWKGPDSDIFPLRLNVIWGSVS